MKMIERQDHDSDIYFILFEVSSKGHVYVTEMLRAENRTSHILNGKTL